MHNVIKMSMFFITDDLLKFKYNINVNSFLYRILLFMHSKVTFADSETNSTNP